VYSEGQFVLPDVLKALSSGKNVAEDSAAIGQGGARKIRIGASISTDPPVTAAKESSGSALVLKPGAGGSGENSAVGTQATTGQGEEGGGSDGGGEAGPIGKLVEGILTEVAEDEDEEEEDAEEDALVFEDHADYQDYDEDDDEYY
jgi:hypothetical protein